MKSVRDLPSVDQVIRDLLTSETRQVLAELRDQLKAGAEVSETPVSVVVEQRLRELSEPSLRPVINATGVILHTNLGRAPFAHFKPIPRYSNLEYDLATGKRGQRDVHTSALLQRLLGVPAIVVNNNAAAVYLVLNELAAGGEVIVSRGELIEIGDGFRIPDIMARSGALLREVGTTNRTRIEDYPAAISARTKLILRVHPSNFHISGFAERPNLEQLTSLGAQHGIPVYEDLGSGCLVDLREQGIKEPLVTESLRSGVNIVSFSCDKLLGGPQSGIIAGDAELVHRVRRNPMYRAFRVDKLVIESLQATLRQLLLQNWDSIPTLRAIFTPLETLIARGTRVAEALSDLHAVVSESESPIGGGSTPDQYLQTAIVTLCVPDVTATEERLRRSDPPVIARISRDKLVLDMRTLADEELEPLVRALRKALAV